MSLGVKVKRRCGEQFRKLLVETDAFDRSRKISSDESHIYMPVRPLDEEEMDRLRRLSDFELVEMDFHPEEQVVCPEGLLGYRPSFEAVGDIAVVEDERAEEVASALMSCCRSIKAVIAPISDVEGEFRTRRFRHIAGEKRTITTHKEHGLRYRVDLEGAYFTPRLGTERLRVAEQVNPSDVVLDMFAGVGPFSLLFAKRGARVIAIEKNPVAVKYLKENALLNKIQDIEILEGDAADLAPRYENMADHVIMNLPHSAAQFLIPAMRAARNGGVIHYYAIAPEESLYRDADLIKKASEQLGFSVNLIHQGIVRSYAPKRYNVVIEFSVRKPSN
ncbi:MAG TPA: class I SAM-dependent methyltransferase family protein [Methanotrichaceae archaeon]|nr:class I SAM-dependent methyltransferase family protein [Methanotrichaceae archaeon]